MCRKQEYTVEVKGFAAAGRPSTVGGGRRFAGAVLPGILRVEQREQALG
jgi:hypothetical protein